MKLVLIDCQDVQRVGSSSTYRLGTNIASGSDYDIGDGLEINIDKAVTGKVIWLSVYAGTTFNNLTFYPMLAKGTEAKIYEKYGATPSLEFSSEITTVKDNVNEVICNKNLLNQYKIVPYYIDGENKVQSWEGEVESLYIQIKSNTAYTVSKKISARFTIATSTEVPRVGLTVNAVSNRQANKLTITSKNEDKYLMIFYYKKTDDTLSSQEIISSIQVEEGTVATAYVKHQSQSIAMPVQQEMLQGDYFDFENEKEVHKWNLLSFTGNEAWSLLSGATSVFLLGNVSGQTYAGHNFSMCTHFKYDTRVGGMANLQDETFAMQYEYSALYVKCNKFTTVEEWKAYLKSQYENGTPIKLAYITANITELSFTDEQKVVAKKIKETLHTYKNITHIYSTDETSPKIDIEYAKDLNTQNNNLQNQIDEIKQLISTTQTSAMLLDYFQKEVVSEVE